MTTNAAVIKSVAVKGKILNDSATNVDHLDHSIYANALADKIHEIETPVSIGIFSNWGSGKTFLLRFVQSLLDKKQREKDQSMNPKKQREKDQSMNPKKQREKDQSMNPKKQREKDQSMNPKKQREEDQSMNPKPYKKNIISVCSAMSIVIFLLVFGVLLTFAILLRVTFHLIILSTVFIVILIVLLVIFYLMIQFGGIHWFSSLNSFNYTWTLVYAWLTQLPISYSEAPPVRVSRLSDIKLEQKTVDELANERSTSSYQPLPQHKYRSDAKRKYIFVHFNAWEYTGSDVLWAGIITNIAMSIENALGVVMTRVFRAVNLQTIIRCKSNNRSNTLLAKLPGKNAETVKKFMSKYGNVFLSCQEENNSSGDSQAEPNNWWKVTFSLNEEAENACKTLLQSGIAAKLSPEVLPKGVSQCAHFWNHFYLHAKRTCGIPNLYWLILFFVSAVSVPVICWVYLFPKATKTAVAKGPLTAALVLSLVPGSLWVGFFTIKFIWALCNSQTTRIANAVQGAQANMASQLGLMNKVKQEISLLTNLLLAVEYAQNIQFKVVITIDDLDRIPPSKVKAVLECISILLSERFSPYICMIAVDSRTIVNAFESNDQTNLPLANGYEYIRKIINLPFCLPQIDKKDLRQYIAGLIDEADETKERFELNVTSCSEAEQEVVHREPRTAMTRIRTGIGKSMPILRAQNPAANLEQPEPEPEQPEQPNSPSPSPNIDDEVASSLSPEPKRPKEPANVNPEGESSTVSQTIKTTTINDMMSGGKSINFENLLFECRDIMLQNESVNHYIVTTPKHVKRMFNVISITVSVINSQQEKIKHEDELSKIANNRMNPHPESSQGGRSHESNQDNPPPERNEANDQIIQIDPEHKSLAKDIVLWVILSEQWPFRVSYIVEAIMRDHRAHALGKKEKKVDDKSLLAIYHESVKSEIKSSAGDKQLLLLDKDEDVLESFLSFLETENKLYMGRVKELLRYTTNLDQSLRKSCTFTKK